MQSMIFEATQGRPLDVLGNAFIEKAASSDLNGGAAVFVQTVQPAGGPPPHFHCESDEFFYMLEGELEVWVGGKHATLRPGMSATLPRAVPHRFDNATDQPAKVLIVVTPGSGAQFFDDIDAAHLTMPGDMEKLGAILARHDIHFVDQPA